MQSFLNACGAQGPIQVEVISADSATVTRHVVDQPFLVIGRDPGADLVLSDEQVSRRHAYLQLIDGRFFVIDMGSRTGTVWGDGPRASGWLDPEQEIGVGPYRIRFRGPDPESEGGRGDAWAQAETPLGGAEPEWLAPSLSINLPVDGQYRSLQRVLTVVGSSPACNLLIRRPEISNFHCALVRTPSGAWVVDLLGSGETLVNGASVRVSPLRDGDELAVWRMAIRLRCGPVARAKPPRIDTQPCTGLPAVRRSPTAPATRPTVLPPAAASESSGRTELLAFSAQNLTGGGDGPERLLVPVLSQFSLMQQQMFEQFQQTMVMMAQMFGNLHRDQAELIRSEFDRMNQLGREVEALKAELLEHREMSKRREHRPAGPRPFGPALMDRSRAPELDASNEAATADSNGPGPATNPPTEARPSRAPSATEEEFLINLHQRLAEIQSERQSHWQKLLKLLPGQRGGESMP